MSNRFSFNTAPALSKALLTLSAAAIAATTAGAPTASAAGLSVPYIGGEKGYPVTSNPSAIFYNPAALSLGEGTQLEIDATLVFRSATYTHEFEGDGDKDVAEPDGAEGANNGTATLFNVIGGPSIFYATHLDDLSIGAGFYVPYGGSVQWDKNEDFENTATYPGAVDGVARWHSIEGSLIVANLSLGGAYKLDRLSLGLAGNLMYSQVSFNQARTPGSDNNIGSEGRSLIEASGWDFSFTVGVTAEIVREELWVGLSYLSKPNFGDGSTLTGTLDTTFPPSPPTQDDIEFHQNLPDVIRGGVRYVPDPAIEIRLSGDYTRWSSLHEQCVAKSGSPCGIDEGKVLNGTLRHFDRSFTNAWGARLGFSYFPTKKLELLGGIGFDSNAIPAENLDPALMDSDDLSATIGVSSEVSDSLSLGAQYTHIQFFDRDTRGQSELALAPSGGRNVDGAGQYSQWMGMLNVSMQARF
jgi:long-chain fatty acid transport protein